MSETLFADVSCCIEPVDCRQVHSPPAGSDRAAVQVLFERDNAQLAGLPALADASGTQTKTRTAAAVATAGDGRASSSSGSGFRRTAKGKTSKRVVILNLTKAVAAAIETGIRKFMTNIFCGSIFRNTTKLTRKTKYETT